MAEKMIKSPYPGTFYRRPSPDADVYVTEGDQVEPGDTVGLVEIMKNFYEVKSEESGVVNGFLVANEGLVEAGQDLIVLRD